MRNPFGSRKLQPPGWKSTRQIPPSRFPGHRIHRRLARQGPEYDPRRVAGGGLRQGFASRPHVRRTLRGRHAVTSRWSRCSATGSPGLTPSMCSFLRTCTPAPLGLDRRGTARLPGKADGHRRPRSAPRSSSGPRGAASRSASIIISCSHRFTRASGDDLTAGKLGRPTMSRSPGTGSWSSCRSGPFNLWMLRDPRNIMLEIGPHSWPPSWT